MEFVLEINTEEMPLLHVKVALQQLKRNFKDELVSQDLVDKKKRPGKIETYGTCRRLIVYGDLMACQKNKEEIVVGPPKSVAFAPDGSPTPAVKGFARSQGVKVDSLEVVSSKKGDYIAVKKHQKGRPARDVLPQILPDIINGLSFPKMMRWGANDFKFSRPIRYIFCILDGKPLSFRINGILTVDFTTGHKLYFPGPIKVKSFQEYRRQLKKNKVLIEEKTRKARIINLIEKKMKSLEAQCYPDEKLLNKLATDVEYPYVFWGTFPKEYLKLPIEILSTAMREGQNLLSVIKGKKQLPVFLGVSDACNDEKGFVSKGNERVLKARLEDACFFWEQDSKIPLIERAKNLRQIVFQESLGSYKDKSERIKKISLYLTNKLDAGKNKLEVRQAAELCKADLLTEMVREFPSLQGKVGGIYARKEKYSLAVWKAIYEHYQPASLDDPSPSSLTGAILAVSDKLDSIVGVMGLGIEVSGSKDPFGLRRNAQGICSIVIDKKLSFPFPRLLDKVIKVYENNLNKNSSELKEICLQFFENRLEYIFSQQGFRYDLINAVLSPGVDDIYNAFLKLKALNSLKDNLKFKTLILAAKRVNNILRGQPKYRVNQDLLIEKEERELYTTYSIIRENVRPLFSSGDFSKAQRIVLTIGSSIDNFFDNVMVMAEDKRVKRNRLALLQEVSKLFDQIADYSEVVIEGEKD